MDKIREITEKTLDKIIRFAGSYEVLQYNLNKINENWREFEEEFSVSDSPFCGIRVSADEKRISEWSMKRDTLVINSVELAPHEISEELSTFPIDDVSIVYLVSIVEVFGNEVCKLCNPNYIRERTAWHRQIYLPDGDFAHKDFTGIRKGFADPFNANPDSVQLDIAMALAHLKSDRNQIVHEKNSGYSFSDALLYSIAIICHINYLASDDKEPLNVCPWTDDDNFVD